MAFGLLAKKYSQVLTFSTVANNNGQLNKKKIVVVVEFSFKLPTDHKVFVFL